MLQCKYKMQNDFSVFRAPLLRGSEQGVQEFQLFSHPQDMGPWYIMVALLSNTTKMALYTFLVNRER